MPGSLFPVGSTTVTYTFVDSSGNTASTSFNVVVVEECKFIKMGVAQPSVDLFG